MTGTTHRLSDVTGSVIGVDGRPIGTIVSYYLDEVTGEPTWVRVTSADLEGADGILPAHDGEGVGRDFQTPYTLAKVSDAPRLSDPDGKLTPEQERELYAHYGLEYNQVRGGGAAGVGDGAHAGRNADLDGDVDRPTSGRHADTERTDVPKVVAESTPGADRLTDDRIDPSRDISDPASGHNPLRTDPATHVEGELRPEHDQAKPTGDGMNTRGIGL